MELPVFKANWNDCWSSAAMSGYIGEGWTLQADSQLQPWHKSFMDTFDFWCIGIVWNLPSMRTAYEELQLIRLLFWVMMSLSAVTLPHWIYYWKLEISKKSAEKWPNLTKFHGNASNIFFSKMITTWKIYESCIITTEACRSIWLLSWTHSVPRSSKESFSLVLKQLFRFYDLILSGEKYLSICVYIFVQDIWWFTYLKYWAEHRNNC